LRLRQIALTTLIIIIGVVAAYVYLSHPVLRSVDYKEGVEVGGLQVVSARVRGSPSSVEILVHYPDGRTKRFESLRAEFKVDVEGVYEVEVRVKWFAWVVASSNFSFWAYDVPKVEVEAPRIAKLGEEVVAKIVVEDSSPVKVAAYLNGTPIPVFQEGEYWVASFRPERLGTYILEVSAEDPYGNRGTAGVAIIVRPPRDIAKLAGELGGELAEYLYDLYLKSPELVEREARERPRIVKLAVEYYSRGVLTVEEALAVMDSDVVKVAFLLELECWNEDIAKTALNAASELSKIGVEFAAAYYPTVKLLVKEDYVDEVLRLAGEVAYYTYSHASILRIPERLVKAEVEAGLKALEGMLVVEETLVLPWGEVGNETLVDPFFEGWVFISPMAGEASLYSSGAVTILEVPRFPEVGVVGDVCLVDVTAEDLVKAEVYDYLLRLAVETAEGRLGEKRAVIVPLSLLVDIARLEAANTSRGPTSIERLHMVPGSEERWESYEYLLGEAAYFLDVVGAEAWEERVCEAINTWVFWVDYNVDGEAGEFYEAQEEALGELGLVVHDMKVAGRAVRRYVYWLQNVDLDVLKSLPVDLVIIDPDDTGFTADEVEEVKASGKIVLAYVDIGEAEEWRDYWEESWRVNPPDWIGIENPDWPGCYYVKYWDEEWQSITYDRLRKVVELGYDGVYLDGIDVYEYWEEEGYSGAEELMVSFVINISEYLRELKPGFLVFPQNALELLRYEDYLEAIDGVGKEDTWFLHDKRRSPEEVGRDLELLRLAKSRGKIVLVIDYPTSIEKIREFFENALREGFAAYVGPLDLDRVGYYEPPG